MAIPSKFPTRFQLHTSNSIRKSNGWKLINCHPDVSLDAWIRKRLLVLEDRVLNSWIGLPPEIHWIIPIFTFPTNSAISLLEMLTQRPCEGTWRQHKETQVVKRVRNTIEGMVPWYRNIQSLWKNTRLVQDIYKYIKETNIIPQKSSPVSLVNERGRLSCALLERMDQSFSVKVKTYSVDGTYEWVFLSPIPGGWGRQSHMFGGSC